MEKIEIERVSLRAREYQKTVYECLLVCLSMCMFVTVCVWVGEKECVLEIGKRKPSGRMRKQTDIEREREKN